MPMLEQNERLGEAQLLLELSRELTSSLDLQTVLDRTFRALRRLVDFSGGANQLINGTDLVAAATDPPASEDAKKVRIPLGQGISGTIAISGQPVYIPNIWDDPRVNPEGRKKGVSAGVVSYFGAPLILRGQPIGVVQIDSPNEDAFSREDCARVLEFLPTIAAAVQNANLYDFERRAVEQLREMEQLKHDFLALLPHELRTPLTTITGFGHTLAKHADRLDAETIADIGQRMWRAGRRLERVMSDLFELSYIEQGILVADIGETEIEPILRWCVREQTDQHPITLEVERDIGCGLVDPDRLHQVVGNLLSNARKFSPEGTPISVRARREDGTIAIDVIDHGRGIPEDLHDRVFDRFYQVEPAINRSTEGLGVGLYLVKIICSRMNATVSLSSEPGSGTIVTIRVRAA